MSNHVYQAAELRRFGALILKAADLAEWVADRLETAAYHTQAHHTDNDELHTEDTPA